MHLRFQISCMITVTENVVYRGNYMLAYVQYSIPLDQAHSQGVQ